MRSLGFGSVAIAAVACGSRAVPRSAPSPGQASRPSSACLHRLWSAPIEHAGGTKLVFSPDDRELAITSGPATKLDIVESRTGKLARSIEPRVDGRIGSSWSELRWRGDRILLVDGYEYIALRAHDLSTVCAAALEEHSLAPPFYQPDGPTFPLLQDRTPVSFDATTCTITPRPLSSIEKIIAGYPSDEPFAVAVTSDRRYLYVMPTSPSELDQVHVWELASGTKVPAPANATFPPTEYFLDVAAADGDPDLAGRAMVVLDPATLRPRIREAVDLDAVMSPHGLYLAEHRCKGEHCSVGAYELVRCSDR